LGEQCLAEWILRPVLTGAGLRTRRPTFGFRVENIDFEQAVLALHIVAAKNIYTPIGQRYASVAVGVVKVALESSTLLERGAVQGEVGLV
jgi:hypothetical protein